MEDFQINEYLPLRDVVFETLRQKILKGELKPGERLIEVALAQRLGVSRTPVREAIHKLEQEGLVVMAPRKGAQVATISAQSVRDVLEVRKAMECLAVCLAISRITPQERIALRQAEEAFAAASRGNDLRLLLRGRTKGLLPLSALTGGVLLLLADIAARLAPGAELPVSVLTTMLGVPCVALLMAKGGARRE